MILKICNGTEKAEVCNKQFRHHGVNNISRTPGPVPGTTKFDNIANRGTPLSLSKRRAPLRPNSAMSVSEYFIYQIRQHSNSILKNLIDKEILINRDAVGGRRGSSFSSEAKSGYSEKQFSKRVTKWQGPKKKTNDLQTWYGAKGVVVIIWS